jgi:hypothetical protein
VHALPASAGEQSSARVIRFLLLIGALIAAAIFIAAHGVRAIALLVVVVLVVTLPNTRVWKIAEGALVRLTGSRRRAYLLVTVVVIAVLIGVNVYEFVH